MYVDFQEEYVSWTTKYFSYIVLFCIVLFFSFFVSQNRNLFNNLNSPQGRSIGRGRWEGPGDYARPPPLPPSFSP